MGRSPRGRKWGMLSCTPVRARVAEAGPQKRTRSSEQHERSDQGLSPSPALPSRSPSKTPPGRCTVKPNAGTKAGSQSKYDVCEVFSPPRLCPAATARGLRGGWSIDIAIRDPSTGRRFGLRNSRDQTEVKRLVRRDCPTVLVISPPCTAFSIANQAEIDRQTLESAIEMIRFSIELC